MPGTGEPITLRCDRISKRFGLTRALDDVSVSFLAGEVHALMGENGAGKSTLGKVIAGLHRQDSGAVEIDGRALPPGSLDAAFRAGVRIVHQELAQCPSLSVAENLCLHELPFTPARTVDRARMRRRAAALLERLEPGIDPDSPLGSLSPGHRQIVQIAAALDLREDAHAGPGSGGPRVIVFDEPTSSLSIAETERLLRIVRQLASEGLTVIYVSHRMGEIFACCDRVTVLRDGRLIATGRVAEIDEPTLVERMIGRRLDTPAPRRAALRAFAGERPRDAQLTPDPGPAALEVRGLSSPGRLHDIWLRVAPGEVLGIGGLVGSGRSELLDAIFGLDPRATGDVVALGRPLGARTPRRAIRAGLGYIPEDRRLQGLLFELGVVENILLPIIPRLARAGIRSPRREHQAAAARMREFQVKAASPGAPPATLSGGNQQKLLIARWMTPETRVLLLDEPTRGIDVGTKAEVYRLIRAAADRGTAVLLISSEMPELLALSDRIVVLCAGRLTGELRDGDMTQANILRMATAEQ
ncbi:MAG: sugar ABC transporter ATP-binding protein [Phycisphaerales bacterium]